VHATLTATKLNANRNQSQRLPPHREGRVKKNRERNKVKGGSAPAGNLLRKERGIDRGGRGGYKEGYRCLNWYFKHCQAHNQNA